MNLKFKITTKFIIFVSSFSTTCLVVFISINANRHLKQMSQNNTELYSAFRISELMKSFRSNLIIMEKKQKGFLAQGDPRFLEDYKIEESETKTYLKSMEKYFSGKAEEELFYRLKDLTYKKLTEAKDLSKGSVEAFRLSMRRNEDAGIRTIDELHEVIDLINSSLNQSTKVLIDNSVEYVRVSKTWGYIEVAVAILVAIGAVIIVFRDVNVRTKLENELRVAKKQAEHNAMLKEQFMANVSHEIRTPMNAILGFSNLMNKTNLSKDQEEYLYAIRSSSSNLLNIINDILDFSKIEAGKLHIEKIPFHPAGLIDSLKMMFAQKAAEKKIDFEVQMDEKLPAQVFGDPTRLTQILINLVNNAIKFTNEGSVKLSCEVKSIEHELAQLVFRIKDTGIGIPADKINQVFERFHQGNEETTRKYGGTGLGLTIVKSLLEIQNGDIYVKSKEGAGSEFIVTISYPISYELKKEVPDLIDLALPPIANRELTVLIVEDNVLNQKLASTYLESFGLTSDIAENGLIALEKMKENRYDLVLMDIQMPVVDGYTAALRMRQELHLTIPIIAMTAHIMAGEKEKCLSYGMNDYISKPFKEVELYYTLKQHLNAGERAVKLLTKRPLKPGNAENIVSADDLYELSRGNTVFVQEMIDIFIEQNPLDISQLEKAILTGDLDTTRAVAHRMKTSVGFMGIKSLLPVLARIENIAETKIGLSELTGLLNEVKSSCGKAIPEFRSILATLN